ncbi:MAG: type I-B CRISPR-associated protein Cas8b1/Cst1, partial [Brevinematia bacterium]
MIIHHRISFTQLDDGSEIFINSPSFKEMYHLNKFAKEVFRSRVGSLDIRKILGMTLIEHSIKLRT